jgi:pyruvate,water dikinase
LPLSALDLENAPLAGGKAAGLTAALSAHLPVPAGFVATTAAGRRFLEHSGLPERIRTRLGRIKARSIREHEEAAAEIREWVLAAPLPAGLEAALQEAYREVAPNGEPVAVRSSASREDSPALSFAGQYASFLGVTEATLTHHYKEVVASQFSARAVLYLLSQGLEPASEGMGVLFQRLVAPVVAAGVLFTRDPDRCQSQEMVVGATWGLAAELVSGAASGDTFRVSRTTGELLESKVRPKPHRLEAREGRLVPVPVAEADVQAACLPPEVLTRLWDYGLKLEESVAPPGTPQDVEWAWDGRSVYIVQSRPLRLANPLARCSVELAQAAEKAEVLLSGATPGAYGAAAGPVFIAAGELDPDAVPPGSVLVVPHTSPRLAPLLPRVAAIVAEVGAATGHLALLAREYGVPLLVDAAGALGLPPEEEVTVDAHAGKVYRGRLEELLRLVPRRERLFAATPIHARLKAILDLIVPLNLVDARQPNFKAAACRTYHDITRFAHEKAVELMFGVIDDVDLRHDAAVRVRSPLPFNLYVIDLGGGLRPGAGPKWITLEDIVSVPMQALWRGMSHPGITWAGPVPVDVGGFLHVVAQTAIRAPEDFWDKTYALVAEYYLNYSSRLGYHYSSVDGYCGPRRNDNYLNFTFKGGAADEPRRCRRATLIGKILDGLGFETEVHCDLVRGRFRKFGCEETEQRLEMLGRLMGFVRQMDMIMSDDEMVDLLAGRFLAGNYSRTAFEETAGAP